MLFYLRGSLGTCYLLYDCLQMYVEITYNVSPMCFSLRCSPPNITLLF